MADVVQVPYVTEPLPVPQRDNGEDLHPRAVAWYESLGRSGQSRWYEPSDWLAAQIIAIEYDRYLTADAQHSTMLSTILAEMEKLGTTEAARRRMRIEVERPEADPSTAEDVEAAGEVEEQMRRLAGGG